MYDYIKGKYKNIVVVGYTDTISEYMKKADLIISKSGGITLFEAIHSEVPIYVIEPFLVQEIKNAQYIEREKIGKVIWKKNFYIEKDIIELINNDVAVLEMKRNMKKIKEKLRQEEIINIIEKFKRGA